MLYFSPFFALEIEVGLEWKGAVQINPIVAFFLN
jgi:hypothetical protein